MSEVNAEWVINYYLKTMSKSDNGGCLAIFAIIIPIATWLGAGYMSWNWIEPENFWGAIKFIIVWGILGYIGQIISGLIIVGIAKMME